MTLNKKGWAILTPNKEIMVLKNQSNQQTSQLAIFKTFKEAKKIRTQVKKDYPSKTLILSISPCLVAVLPDDCVTRKMRK